MRILFNHGMTAGELYTNTPKKVIDRSWRWFIRTYGRTDTKADALSRPFSYCIALIIHKMLDDKMRFILPLRTEAYWDFECVYEEEFKKQRNQGRFKEIDIIGSDFSGYALRYFFKAKAYLKSYPMYLGGDLKKKFLEKINSGEKFYTSKDFKLDDIIDEVYKQFPELTEKEIKNLLLHGFRRMHSCTKFGCALTLNAFKYLNCYIYVGNLNLNPEKQIKEYNIRRDRKLRKIAGWERKEFDGYYYIALNEKAFNKWLELNKTSRTIVKFEEVIPRKIQKELYYKYRKSHVFRISRDKFKGWSYWADSIKSRDVKYLGRVDNLKFYEEDKTWKQLIKEEYEKRSC